VVIEGIDPSSSAYEAGAHPSTPYHLGVSYEDRTHDGGITTRGFTTKLTSPYSKHTADRLTMTYWVYCRIPSFISPHVFLYGRGTENRTLIYGLKARYFGR
jgi:hypothetical protein